MADIRLDLIHVPLDPGSRRIPPSNEQEEAFVQSVNILGIIEPVVVRRSDDGATYVLCAGRRRVEAARTLKHETIPAIVRSGHGQAEDIAIDAAENMARAPLAVLDQWRVDHSMTTLENGEGWAVKDAAAALGLTERQARRMERLGRLHPSVLDAMHKRGVPDDRLLAAIASASAEKQAKVMKGMAKQFASAQLAPWLDFASELEVKAIPRSAAIFDTEKAGIAWQEDIFAEPGSPEQWTTTEIRPFITAQTKALRAMVGRRITEGERLEVADTDDNGYVHLPESWYRIYDAEPERTTIGSNDDPRKCRFVYVDKVVSSPRFGEIVYLVAQREETAAEKRTRVRADRSTAPAEADPTDEQASERGPYNKA